MTNARNETALTQHQLAGIPAVQQELLLAEYNSLRTEILKLIELQAQFHAVTVVAFGTLASVAFQAKNPQLLLIQPLVALIFGVLWMNNAHSICRCARYLRKVEARFGAGVLGWEHYVGQHDHPQQWIGFWGVRAMFAVSSILAVAASLTIKSPKGVWFWLLFVVAALVTCSTMALSYWWREQGEDRTRPDREPDDTPQQ